MVPACQVVAGRMALCEYSNQSSSPPPCNSNSYTIERVTALDPDMVVGISSNPDTKILNTADISIFTDTGAEVLTGSTRLKAGTAQKLVLNMLTTGAMIKSGYVYENLMIDMQPTNEKLVARAEKMVMEITGVSNEEAKA